MRLNRFIAQATGLSRRAADSAINEQRVKLNGNVANLGEMVSSTDKVTLDDVVLEITEKPTTIMLNKPVGYVCSRDGQGSKTIYDLLPVDLRQLKPVGRLDKDSSGLLLLTNDGKLAHQLTHPSFQKEKVYEIVLHKPLTAEDKTHVEQGIELDDGPSRLRLNGNNKSWTVTMSEGRNRQIRRTFSALDYTVAKLHRIQFGEYELSALEPGRYKPL